MIGGNKFASLILGAVSALSVGGCSTVEGLRPDIAARPVPSRLDEIAYINVLRSAFVVQPKDNNVLCFDGTGLKPFRSKSGQGFHATDHKEDEVANSPCITYKSVSSDAAGKADLRNYLTAGFGLTDLYCQRFFTVTNASEQNRKFGRTFSSGVDVLVSSVLTLSGAGELPVGIANAGFGLIDKTFEGYDAAYLVAPDMSNVRKLVLASQDEYRKQALDETQAGFPRGFGAARSVIERYAGICTFSGMRELINKSLKDKTDEINKNLPKGTEPPKGGDDGGKGGVKNPPALPSKPQPKDEGPKILETPVPQG